MNNYDLINEVRSKIDIVDLISEYLPLTQKGKNYFGVCPFHNDTNPSMSVSREKQIYKCFSCGASGNVFNFVSNYENISFKEALEKLSLKVGVRISNTKIKEKNNVNEKYYEIYDLAVKFYQNNINTLTGKKAKDYLINRSIDNEVIKKFQIGYSLDKNNTLLSLLTKKGYSYRDIYDMGLVTDNHDIYIDRIMFPLYDTNGRVVAFSGRIYDNSGKNKYVNTKETAIFKKGHCLYNYHIAKEACRKSGYVIIMEGFMDVIRASTIGLNNVVALMGTALTSDQINLIKKLSMNIILCFDGDNAGHHATMSVGNDLEKIGINPKVINLEGGDDPDSYILKFGSDSFYSLIDSAINFSDYKINNLRKGVNFNSDIELAEYVDKVLKETSLIKDEIRREIILKKLAIECNLGYNTLEKRLANYVEKTNTNTPLKKVSEIHLSRYAKACYALFYSMLMDSTNIEACKKENIFFADSSNRNLYNEILYYYEKYGSINIADMYTYLADGNKEDLLALYTKINEKDDYDYSSEAVLDYINVIKIHNTKMQIKHLSEKLKNETDLIKKSEIAEEIRLIKIGENNHG